MSGAGSPGARQQGHRRAERTSGFDFGRHGDQAVDKLLEWRERRRLYDAGAPARRAQNRSDPRRAPSHALGQSLGVAPRAQPPGTLQRRSDSLCTRTCPRSKPRRRGSAAGTGGEHLDPGPAPLEAVHQETQASINLVDVCAARAASHNSAIGCGGQRAASPPAGSSRRSARNRAARARRYSGCSGKSRLHDHFSGQSGSSGASRHLHATARRVARAHGNPRQ